MPICLAFPSSFELLRLRRVLRADGGLPVDAGPVPLSGERFSEFERLPGTFRAPTDEELACWLERRPGRCSTLRAPVHVYVPDDRDRRRSAMRTCAVGRAYLPYGAFTEMDGAWVPTPEYCFVEAGCFMSLAEQVLLGMELCGAYTLGEEGSQNGFVRTAPVTTRSRLMEFCAAAPRLRGVGQARRAAEFVLNGSASPAESRLAAVLFLPKRLGGYGLPPGQLNRRREMVVARQADRPAHRVVVPDISWDSGTVVVEYDSSSYHAAPSLLSHDARRRNELVSCGLDVLTVTGNQLNSIRDMDAFALQLCRKMGWRWRRPAKREEWERSQDALRCALGLRVDRSDFDGWQPVVI